jgi:hypothetical protein
MAFFDSIHARTARLRRQVQATRRAVDDARAQTVQALERLGVRPPTGNASGDAGPVVDVEPSDSGVGGVVLGLVRRTGQGIFFVVAVVLLGAALMSLGMFVAASLLAFVVVTRGLGLRVDLGPQASVA